MDIIMSKKSYFLNTMMYEKLNFIHIVMTRECKILSGQSFDTRVKGFGHGIGRSSEYDQSQCAHHI